MSQNLILTNQNTEHSFKPMISIIIPIYKVEDYLDQCVESVVNQTYQNIEIILVDDGSPDKSGVMCDDWAKKDPRIVVIHKKNGGLSDARNKGFEKATGSFISYVDSDDILEHEYIEYLYQAIEEKDADFSECCFSKFSDIPNRNNSQKNIFPVSVLSQEECLIKFSNGSRPYNHYVWNKLYKRELVDNVPFAYGYQSQDILFCCQIFCKSKKAAHIDNVLYHYRSRPGSASNLFKKQRIDALEMTYQSIEYLQRHKPEYVKDLKSYYYFLAIGAVEWTFQKCPLKDQDDYINVVSIYRKKVKLTKEEWKNSSLKQKKLCVCSFPGLIIIVARQRKLLRSVKKLIKHVMKYV